MTTDQTPLLISLNDAARSLGVCRTTFYGLLNEGDIQSIKIKSRRMIVHDSLVTYVKKLQNIEKENLNS